MTNKFDSDIDRLQGKWIKAAKEVAARPALGVAR